MGEFSWQNSWEFRWNNNNMIDHDCMGFDCADVCQCAIVVVIDVDPGACKFVPFTNLGSSRARWGDEKDSIPNPI